MYKFDAIKKVFQSLKCSECDKNFTEESIELIREEENNVVVRISCLYCEKDLGLAILGVDKKEYKNSLKFESTENNVTKNPIMEQEVADANKFFRGLGSDWIKYIPGQD